MILHTQPFPKSVSISVNPCLKTLSANQHARFTLVERPLQVSRLLYKSDFLCKTNPIPKTPKTTQHHLSQRFTTIFPSARREKTNPIKPNRVLTQTTNVAQIPPAFTLIATRHLSPCPFPASRNDIPHPKYEIRNTHLPNAGFHIEWP